MEKTLGQIIGKTNVCFSTVHTKADGETSNIGCLVDFTNTPDVDICEILQKAMAVRLASGHARELTAQRFTELLDEKTVQPGWKAPAPEGSNKVKFVEKMVKSGYSEQKAIAAWDLLNGDTDLLNGDTEQKKWLGIC